MTLNSSASVKGQNKRIRKRKDEIVRKFKCSYPGCDKAYGSDNSLGQHIKIKHKEYSEKFKEAKDGGTKSTPISEANKYEIEEQGLFFEDSIKVEHKGNNGSFECDYQD